MIRMTGNGFEVRSQPSPAVPTERTGTSFDERLEQTVPIAVPVRERLERVLSWRERLSPSDFRRACSAGRLLFQVVGCAGYAGYFVSMHTFMRVLSGALMAGTWYAIYRIKGAAEQLREMAAPGVDRRPTLSQNQ
jgi:hypothetical protein